MHALVGAEVQEIAVGAQGLTRDQVLLKKDFILEDSRIDAGQVGVRDVDVPSPVAGYVGRRDAMYGLVDILDRADGEVIARIRHMNPIRVNVGDTVEYGQALGMQSNQKTKHVHVHMEVDTRYYQHYENYMNDLVSGRLSIDPLRQTQGIEARPIVDDGVIRIGESAGIVRQVQQRLNEEGFRDADNRPLEVDGVYRLSMQAAVINFQQARGLPQTGDIDPVTLQEIAPRVFPPMQNGEQPGEGAHPGFPPYMNRQGAVPDNGHQPRAIDDPLLPQAERAVRQLERGLGREYDEQSACMAASAACLAKANGLSGIDHIFLSVERGAVRRGENLFVVQGEPGDPAHRRAMMKTQDAVSTPVEQSLGQLQALNEVQQRPPPVQAMDEPVREAGAPQMRMG
jgi:peptidoglycan hydrolase-like protein with peptidoglycan-binding domain